MATGKINVGGGVGFFGLLTLIFVVFKLLGRIDWSWWVVLSPMIFSLTLTLLILAAVFGLLVVVAAWK
jgi:hypothetical protein